jgi:predicted SAM-dependent methyltransferase
LWIRQKKGYINCDISPIVNPDKVLDLEIKLLYEDNSVDEVLANHVMEHIQKFIPLMYELNRICKINNALMLKNILT